MNNDEIEEAIRKTWPTIKEILEKQVIEIIRGIKDDPLRAGAMASAGLQLIDSIDNRLGTSNSSKPTPRTVATLRTH